MAFQQLSETEICVMNLFWDKKEPLSGAEIFAAVGGEKWSYRHIYKILRSLQKKGCLSVHSTEMDEHHHRVKRFSPCISKEEYTANFLEAQKLEAAAFAKIAIALIDQHSVKETWEGKDEFIRELENIVSQLKNGRQEE